ncbi:MAG: hypothetical protein H0U57_05025 [Tatlockia sp.]|nr:hypothetical protein [Tatlockia sp.]
MKYIKPFYQNLVFLFLSTLLIACASTRIIGYGKIESIKKINQVNYVPRTTTLKGTAIGAGVGAATGAALGALAGGAAGIGVTIMTFGLALPLLPALIAGGTATGAGIGAGAGAGLGTGAGYASEIYRQGKGLYQIVVKLDGMKDKFIIFQYINKPLLVNSRVEIRLKDNQLHIKE